MADKDAAMHSGVIARTIVLDKLVKTYLAGHGGAVVVNIACGLDTRCYRMSGYSHWYNLDLPETIAVREKLLPESRKISQIAMSAMDDWGGEIKGTSTDVLVIIEGLTMYLSESDVKRIFDVIAARFDRATVLVETMNPMVVKRFKEKSIEASKAKFTWAPRTARRSPRCCRISTLSKSTACARAWRNLHRSTSCSARFRRSAISPTASLCWRKSEEEYP